MAQLQSTAMGAKRAPSLPPSGELLEDRIRDGITGSLTEQIAIGLQVGRSLGGWHSKKRYFDHLSVSSITIDAENNVTLFGGESADAAVAYQNARAFGVILFELLTGRLMVEHDLAEPDIEMLHKAGLPPALVEVVTQCLETPEAARVIEESTKRLEELLRERLGERKASPKPVVLLGVIAVLLMVALVVWKLLR